MQEICESDRFVPHTNLSLVTRVSLNRADLLGLAKTELGYQRQQKGKAKVIGDRERLVKVRLLVKGTLVSIKIRQCNVVIEANFLFSKDE